MARAASTLGNPGDAVGGDDYARPPQYGAAAGPRGVESVLRGGRYLLRERQGRLVSGSGLGNPGFPLGDSGALTVG